MALMHFYFLQVFNSDGLKFHLVSTSPTAGDQKSVASVVIGLLFSQIFLFSKVSVLKQYP